MSGLTLLAAVGGVAAAEEAYAYTPPARAASAPSSSSSAAAPAGPIRSVSHAPKPRVIFVLGGPGAGKGTQCGKLVKEFGFIHLSAGDLLRDERDSGSPDGEMIENFIREGKIVPVEVTVNLIKKAMEKSGATKFLVDGFPRNFNNLEGWQSVMGGHAEVDGVLFYDVSEETLVSRLLKRAETSGRSDDNIDTILKRLKTYNESTVPVVDYYAKQDKVTRIFGGDPVDVVFARTAAAVEPVIQAEVLGYNALLLDAISFGDWAAYESLVDRDVTCFEPEAATDGLVRGTDFHKAVFEQAAKARAAALASGKPASLYMSSMHSPEVRLLGPKHALVTYTRLVSPTTTAAVAAGAAGAAGASAAPAAANNSAEVTRVSESRMWRLVDGKWRLLHFHRNKA